MQKFTVTIQRMPLPDGIRGAVMSFEKGNEYLIATNESLTEMEQAEAFLHECLHIYRGDLESGRTAAEIENETSKLFSLLAKANA